MASKCNLAVLCLSLAAVFANACVREQTRSQLCGGTHDDPEEGPDWDRSRPVRYVEKPADPNESAGNAPPNWSTSPVMFKGSEIVHFFPAEQALDRSIPFYLELPEEYAKWKVILRYKVFGAMDWKKLEMRKHNRGRIAEIPCLEVNVTGHLRYFLQVENAESEIEELIGSRKEPFILEVRDRIEGGQPVIEGHPLPTHCVIESP